MTCDGQLVASTALVQWYSAGGDVSKDEIGREREREYIWEASSRRKSTSFGGKSGLWGKATSLERCLLFALNYTGEPSDPGS